MPRMPNFINSLSLEYGHFCYENTWICFFEVFINRRFGRTVELDSSLGPKNVTIHTFLALIYTDSSVFPGQLGPAPLMYMVAYEVKLD